MRCDQNGMAARSGAQPISRILASDGTTQTPVLATTRRDGTIWAHFVVASPCNIRDIAADSAPRTASHIASVAHVDIIETGSSLRSNKPRNGVQLRLTPGSVETPGQLLSAIKFLADQPKGELSGIANLNCALECSKAFVALIVSIKASTFEKSKAVVQPCMRMRALMKPAGSF